MVSSGVELSSFVLAGATLGLGELREVKLSEDGVDWS